MTDITKLARDQECLIRLPECCNGRTDTTVPCHFRLIGVSGMSLKVPDFLIAFGCYECHDAVDRRRYKNLDYDYVRLAHALGVMRTQANLIERGVIHW